MASVPADTLFVAAIVGATGTGKSQVALEVAIRLGGTIISADSMQVYKGMDIGTAKIPIAERRGIPHALIDVVSPRHHFSVAEYQKLATDAIMETYVSGRLPILVGGTGLYIRAVLDGYEFLPERPNANLRSSLRRLPKSELRLQLATVDPVAAEEIAVNDVRRLERALEMHIQSGKLPSMLKRRQHGVAWRSVRIGLRCDRRDLYRRLDERVDAMRAHGMEAEVRGLLAQGLSMDDTAMQGIGYKELVGWMCGGIGYEEAIRLWKQRTRNYAKRQETWFKKESGITWIDVTDRTLSDIACEVTDIIMGNAAWGCHEK